MGAEMIRYWRKATLAVRVGLWAGREGWSGTHERCRDCGEKMYTRGNDYACVAELMYRWERRTR